MIEIDGLTVHAGSFSLRNASLTVPAGAYGILMGKSGAGKSTLLEAVSGLKHIAAGTIRLCGIDVTNKKPALRGIGYVPQDGALFSTMTVAKHLAFALEIRRVGDSVIKHRVQQLTKLLDIGGLLARTPSTLSGGERQRVALGRALAFHPHTLLLDEPLSSVDDATRGEMYQLLKSVQRHTGVTTLHVTHNGEEAHALADRLFILADGSIRQCDDTEAVGPTT